MDAEIAVGVAVVGFQDRGALAGVLASQDRAHRGRAGA
jgi:hypothetical protein